MDTRDYRKQWLNLQESWKTQDQDVNVSATKKEKLEEGKVPDSFKAHQFKKKGEKSEDSESPAEEKDDKKKATEAKNFKFKVGSKCSPEVKQAADASTKAKANAKKKATEDAGASPGEGATTSVPQTSNDPSTGPVGIARFSKRIGCGKPETRLPPGSAKESAGKKLFSHFRKFLEMDGLNLEQDPGAVAPEMDTEVPVEPAMDDLGADASPQADLLADLQTKFPGCKITVTIEAGEVPFDAQTVEKAQEVAATVPVEGDIEDIGGDEDVAAMGGEMDGEEPIAPEIDEGAMSNLDIVAQDVAGFIAECGGIEGKTAAGGCSQSDIIAFIQQKHPEALPHARMIIQAAMGIEEGTACMESIAMGEEGNEASDIEVPEMGVGGEAGGEAPPEGEMGGEEMGGLEAGAEEEPEITSAVISLAPEQWEAFLAGGSEAGGSEDDGEEQIDTSPEGADQEAPSSEEHKSLG